MEVDRNIITGEGRGRVEEGRRVERDICLILLQLNYIQKFK